ncbi:hypothetical protein SLEP1_g56833 [Rubroshorea leprosula]|uniref:Secreted protein n=1 Tax=Rubroshorea leprosula TaxID=152421 RepID=A0AAV5MKT0_9ROSI|nr:hypothetical protein SLEP1_g56833 [Rubroshorea leprosula]
MVTCLLDVGMRLMVARSCLRAIWSGCLSWERYGCMAARSLSYLSMSSYTYTGGLSFPSTFCHNQKWTPCMPLLHCGLSIPAQFGFSSVSLV